MEEADEALESLVRALGDWDQADIMHDIYGDPREYEGEARKILALAKDAQSVDDLTEKIWRLFQRQFDEQSAGPREAYEWVARRVLDA